MLELDSSEALPLILISLICSLFVSGSAGLEDLVTLPPVSETTETTEPSPGSSSTSSPRPISQPQLWRWTGRRIRRKKPRRRIQRKRLKGEDSEAAGEEDVEEKLSSFIFLSFYILHRLLYSQFNRAFNVHI